MILWYNRLWLAGFFRGKLPFFFSFWAKTRKRTRAPLVTAGGEQGIGCRMGDMGGHNPGRFTRPSTNDESQALHCPLHEDGGSALEQFVEMSRRLRLTPIPAAATAPNPKSVTPGRLTFLHWAGLWAATFPFRNPQNIR